MGNKSTVKKTWGDETPQTKASNIVDDTPIKNMKKKVKPKTSKSKHKHQYEKALTFFDEGLMKGFHGFQYKCIHCDRAKSYTPEPYLLAIFKDGMFIAERVLMKNGEPKDAVPLSKKFMVEENTFIWAARKELFEDEKGKYYQKADIKTLKLKRVNKGE